MVKLKGYRTILTNALALAVACGLVITGEEQSAIVAGVVAVVNIYLRFITDTPLGQSGDEDAKLDSLWDNLAGAPPPPCPRCGAEGGSLNQHQCSPA